MGQRHVGGRLYRLWLRGGTALATTVLSGLVFAPAMADEIRFHLRNGSTVCGTLLNEQGGSLAVQTSTGRWVALRRDQILRRQSEPCESVAAPAATAEAATPTPAPAVTAAAETPAPVPASTVDAPAPAATAVAGDAAAPAVAAVEAPAPAVTAEAPTPAAATAAAETSAAESPAVTAATADSPAPAATADATATPVPAATATAEASAPAPAPVATAEAPAPAAVATAGTPAPAVTADAPATTADVPAPAPAVTADVPAVTADAPAATADVPMVVAAATAPVAPLPARQLRFVGSDAIAPRLLPGLADAYIGQAGLQPRGWAAGAGAQQRVQDALGEAGQPRFSISVESTSTTEGYAALVEGRSDIAMATRMPNAGEAKAARAALGIDIAAQENVLALDGLAVIVHPGNPVRRLTMQQIRGIFSGTIAKWSEVGGPDRAIRLFARESEAPGAQMFTAEVMRRGEIAATAQRLRSWQDLAAAVADDPGAIGYATMASVGRSRALNLVASCGIETEASEFALRTQGYPLEGRLSLYPGQAGNAQAEEFVRFALSPAAYEAIQAAGYTSLQPVVGTPEFTRSRLPDSGRPARGSSDPRYNEAWGGYSAAIRNALRLSATFRFEQGSHQLDGRGQRDIERVAAFLRSPEGQKYRVSVLGFTDSVGAFSLNRSVSARRAATVADLLRQRGATVHQVQGYGSVAPVTCDDEPDAALKNRRVEIWLSR